MKNKQENFYSINSNSEADKLKESNNNEITLIFRNQLSADTMISLNKTKLSSFKISDITDILLSKLNKSKEESYIRFFFKGRPLKQEEKIKDLCNKIIDIMIYKYRFFKYGCNSIYDSSKRRKLKLK
jgi:hypothetical protein